MGSITLTHMEECPCGCGTVRRSLNYIVGSQQVAFKRCIQRLIARRWRQGKVGRGTHSFRHGRSSIDLDPSRVSESFMSSFMGA